MAMHCKPLSPWALLFLSIGLPCASSSAAQVSVEDASKHALSGQQLAVPLGQATEPIEAQPWTVATRGPATASVTIIEFSDFECPYCARVAPAVQDIFRAFPNQVRFIFKHNPLPMHAHSPLAHEAALAAGAQGKFWEMHDLLFANQSHLEQADLLRDAKQLNLDLASFQRALENHLYRSLVEEDISEARGLGVTSTPTFFINGNKLVGAQTIEAMKTAINQALGLTRSVNQSPTTASLSGPVEKVDIGGSPFRGGPNAPVTVVEFADFQCPFCSGAVPTLRALLQEYPDEIKWVYKNYPLGFHPDSLLAHKAALAAGAQGKFWEMHDLIYADQKAIKRDDLIEKARRLGLDVNRFVADMDSDQFGHVLDEDKAEAARLGVTGTPTFFINGKKMVGAWPLNEYRKVIQSELNPTVNGKPPTTNAQVEGQKGAQPAALNKEMPYVTVAKGPPGAPVTIIWYSDLESPLEPRSAQLIEELMGEYPDRVRLIFKNHPLAFHPESPLAHEAVLAAARQGKSWEMLDLILSHQRALTREDLIGYATKLHLNEKEFTSDLDAHAFRSTIESDLAEALRQQIRGTPVFLVNGKRLDGIQPVSAFREIIDGVLKGAPLVTSSR